MTMVLSDNGLCSAYLPLYTPQIVKNVARPLRKSLYFIRPHLPLDHLNSIATVH